MSFVARRALEIVSADCPLSVRRPLDQPFSPEGFQPADMRRDVFVRGGPIHGAVRCRGIDAVMLGRDRRNGPIDVRARAAACADLDNQAGGQGGFCLGLNAEIDIMGAAVDSVDNQIPPVL